MPRFDRAEVRLRSRSRHFGEVARNRVGRQPGSSSPRWTFS